jgi:hypothetical protein
MAIQLAAAVIGGAASAIGGLIGAAAARKAKRRAARRVRKLNAKLENLEENRQEIINPYDNVESLADKMSNPFTQLGVATQATEMQVEQTDIALANSLDQLRQTGGGAGGATALAQAALQSKKGVAANIEQQEAQNEKLKAQGEQQLQQQKMSEQQRLQSISISEGQRLQASDAAGKQFEFGAQEARTNQDLNRAAGQQQQAMQSEADANAAKASAIMGGVSAIGSIGAAYAGKPAE